MFIDMMGFAAALEQLTPEEHEALDRLLKRKERLHGLTKRAAKIAHRYSRFQKHMRMAAIPAKARNTASAIIAHSGSVGTAAVTIVTSLAQLVPTHAVLVTVRGGFSVRFRAGSPLLRAP